MEMNRCFMLWEGFYCKSGLSDMICKGVEDIAHMGAPNRVPPSAHHHHGILSNRFPQAHLPPSHPHLDATSTDLPMIEVPLGPGARELKMETG